MKHENLRENYGSPLAAWNKDRPIWVKAALMLTVLAVAAIAGVFAGNWLSDIRKSPNEMKRVDEYVGLGKHTGLTSDLALQVKPSNQIIKATEPINIVLGLKNNSDKGMLLNAWFTPYPADHASNQLPVKIKIYCNNEIVEYTGVPELLKPHTKDDFLILKQGHTKDIKITLPSSEWGLNSPGLYTVEIWYETYLTGMYLGVDAWTGTTNHALVQVQVIDAEGLTPCPLQRFGH